MDLAKISDISDLQALLELMGRYQLCELELEGEGRKIRLKKYEAHPIVQGFPFAAQQAVLTGMPPSAAAPAASPGALPAAAGSPPAEPALPANMREVKSPMVGTFYRAPSPEADPYVKEGDRVEESTVLCIIEAMKVMNEIAAGVSGIVKEILVKNGESVEFSQPIFRIQIE